MMLNYADDEDGNINGALFDAFTGSDGNDKDHSTGIDNPVKLHLEQGATNKDFSYHLDALGSVRSTMGALLFIHVAAGRELRFSRE